MVFVGNIKKLQRQPGGGILQEDVEKSLILSMRSFHVVASQRSEVERTGDAFFSLLSRSSSRPGLKHRILLILSSCTFEQTFHPHHKLRSTKVYPVKMNFWRSAWKHYFCWNMNDFYLFINQETTVILILWVRSFCFVCPLLDSLTSFITSLTTSDGELPTELCRLWILNWTELYHWTLETSRQSETLDNRKQVICVLPSLAFF